MLDLLLLRDGVGGNSNLVRESERRRYSDPALVDEVIAAAEARTKTTFLVENMKRLVNACGKTVAEKKKKKEADGDTNVIPEDILAAAHAGDLDTTKLASLNVLQLKELSKDLSPRVKLLQEQADENEKKRDNLLAHLGNIVHESVPVEQDEDKGNEVTKTFGEQVRKPLNHVDIMEKLGVMDTSNRVTSMAGGRSYVLKGPLVQLHLALVSYAMNYLTQKGYTPFYPPFFMEQSAMGDVAQLSQFDDELYKVSGEGGDKYLIATSEQPLTAYHRNKWYTELPKPIKYAGFSSCFRKEAGSHGRDTLGIFRVHQFDKIEQFIVCSPRDGESWQCLDSMVDAAAGFYESLGLPYRVVNICSGALNLAAAKKLDLEGWFPSSGTYRELVSCSNTTDYLSRKIGARYGQNLRGQSAINVKEHPHLLNGTLCAITRTMCAICENYQTETGVKIPEALLPYMGGKTEMLFADAHLYQDVPAVEEKETKGGKGGKK